MVDASLVVAILAAVGALATGLTVTSRPVVAFGILFLLASFSRATLETPLGTMRMEMPAIAVAAAVLLLRGRFRTLLALPRWTVAVAASFAAYLGVLALSSTFVAPGVAQSLRMVAWLSISMLGGVVSFTLMRSRPVAAIEPLAFVGATSGALGIAVATLFLFVGPGFTVGIQESDTILPRVYAASWETNLYASFLAMTAFFAAEAARGRFRRAGIVMLALILIGFPLGITRAAYLGLAAGLITYAGIRIGTEGRARDLSRLGALATSFLVVGIVASNVLLPNLLERRGEPGGPGASPGPSSQPSAAEPSTGPSSAASPSVPPTATSTLAPYPDTVGFRFERIPIALGDMPQSPLIGFGAESFGQRHPDRHAGAGQDHIAILAVVVPYEAGLIGATALVLGFGLLLQSLLRSARGFAEVGNWRAVGAAAAFLGSLVTILVAYQSNNALHLAINWIVIGAAAALTSRATSGPPGERTAH